jgi:hypothetical protein
MSTGADHSSSNAFAVFAVIVTGMILGALLVLFLRLAFLHRLRSNQLLPRPLSSAPRAQPVPRASASTFSSSLPSSSGKILGSRTELIKSDAEFVAAHTEWLRQRVLQSDMAGHLIDARLRLIEKLAALAAVPALINSSNPNATPASFSLTLAEVEEMLSGMSEISPQLRAAVLRLLHARLKEKLE